MCKILHVRTTFIDRRYTNARVYELASEIAYHNDASRKVKPFSEILDDKRVRLAGHLLRTVDSDPLRQVTYAPGTAAVKQVGKVEQADPGRTVLTVRTNELIHSRSSFSDYVGTERQNHSILAVARRRFIKARRRMVVENIHIYGTPQDLPISQKYWYLQ